MVNCVKISYLRHDFDIYVICSCHLRMHGQKNALIFALVLFWFCNVGELFAVMTDVYRDTLRS